MNERGLNGLRVLTLESRHAKTLSDLVAVHGGEPVSAPALKEVPLEDNPAVFDFAERWFAGRVDSLVLLTGVGARTLVDVLKTRRSETEIFEQMRRTFVVPRGPKSERALREWKVPAGITVPEPNTWRELLEAWDGAIRMGRARSLKGQTVAVQEYGVPNPELAAGLAARGASVLAVPVYRWTLPDDRQPLERAIERLLRREIDVVVFTTAVQADHLFMAAGTSGGAAGRSPLQDAINHCVVASVGPDTSAALRRHGLEPDLEPQSPKMGPLVQLAADRAKEILKAKRS